MPVVSSININSNKKTKNISLSQGLLKHDNIYNDILHELIYSKATLLNVLQNSVLSSDSDKQILSTKEALAGEIRRLCKDKSNAFDFDLDLMINRIINFLLGYGILQDLVEDESISDIDFTRFNHCTIKSNGIKKQIDLKFNSEKEFNNFATLMIVRNGGIINADENHRRESDEKYRLRINVAIPPRNVTGTSLIIRKHRLNPYTLQDLVLLKMLTPELAEYFRDSFKNSKRNTIFVGQGASGKTTLLRACLMEVDILNNFLVCEKDTELYLDDFDNFIIQKIKKISDGGRLVSLKDLVQDGLTMSVEGMVVGELVGDEVYDFLSAGYTDHVIYGTAHTSSVEDTTTRLITMIETGTRRLSENIIKQIIAGSIQDIVYLDSFKVASVKRIIAYSKSTDLFSFLDVKEKIERGDKIE